MTQILLQHDRIPGGHIHKITNWRFQTTASRLDPANQFIGWDIDKVCYDMQTAKYYILQAIAVGTGIPTWYEIPLPLVNAGEANTTSNSGAGAGLALAKSGVNLPFKSLVAGTNVTFNVGATSITIDVAVPSGGSYAPSSHVGSSGVSQHAVASGTVAGFMSTADFIKLAALVTNATHTGDVTGATALTIANDAVTFAKMQNASADSILLGRAQGVGVGDFQQITLASTLAMTSNVLGIADVELLAIAGLTSAVDTVPYFTGSGTAALATVTSFARTILDDVAASDVRTTLGLTAAAIATFTETTFTPVAAGNTTAGAGTYSVQIGKYQRLSSTINGQIEIVYSAHTGTGGLKVTGLPIASAASGRTAVTIYAIGLSIASGGMKQGYIPANSTEIIIDQVSILGTVTDIAIPATGVTLIIGFSYKI